MTRRSIATAALRAGLNAWPGMERHTFPETGAGDDYTPPIDEIFLPLTEPPTPACCPPLCLLADFNQRLREKDRRMTGDQKRIADLEAENAKLSRHVAQLQAAIEEMKRRTAAISTAYRQDEGGHDL